MICISCKTTYDTNFCPNCGERSGVKKITLTSILEDALATLTNMDKGFLYNVKTLTLHPKTVAINYILGKRKGILNPISFLILSVTVYLIVEGLFIPPLADIGTETLPKAYVSRVAYSAGKYVHTYFKYFWILSTIPLALSTTLVFRKYNFMEHLTINSFIIGQATLIGLISYAILKVDMVINPLVYLCIFWLVYRIFMVKKNKLETGIMSVGVMVLFILQLGVIALGIGITMA